MNTAYNNPYYDGKTKHPHEETRTRGFDPGSRQGTVPTRGRGLHRDKRELLLALGRKKSLDLTPRYGSLRDDRRQPPPPP